MVVADRSYGTFVPAPETECNERQWYSNAYDVEGRPISSVRKRYDTWKRGSDLQKFSAALEHNRLGQPIWQGPEMDCSHAMFHVHPNGHRPPSGKQEPLIKVVELFGEEDVALAWKYADFILEETILQVLMTGGAWNESRIIQAAIAGAHQASYEISQLRAGSES